MSARQLPLALRFPPDQRFDTFVADDAAPVALLREVVAGAVDGAFVDGAPGSGKTHLLIAACAQASADGRSVRYLPMSGIADRAGDALASADDADLVAVDDIDALAGDRDAELALFAFHNRAGDRGVRVLYAARQPPQSLPLVLPDLRSRLAQCGRATLHPLNEAGRREVLRQRAQRRGLTLDDAVLDYLFRHVARDLAGLTALLDRIDRESLAAQRRVTVRFLSRLLQG